MHAGMAKEVAHMDGCVTGEVYACRGGKGGSVHG